MDTNVVIDYLALKFPQPIPSKLNQIIDGYFSISVIDFKIIYGLIVTSPLDI